MTGHLTELWSNDTGLVAVRGEGCWVETAEGERYLDFSQGAATTRTGHCHPAVVEAVKRQAERLLYARADCYLHDLLRLLADRLAQITPPPIGRFLFTGSAAEAFQRAVELVRRATGRPHVVVVGSLDGGGAGVTTPNTAGSAGAGPSRPGVFVTPLPDPPATAGGEQGVDRALEAFERLLASECRSEDTAAAVVEPVAGGGGYRPLPKAYVEGIAAICRREGLLLVVDETRSGLGRTGRMFAAEAYDWEPDVMTVADGTASGVPFAAVGARREVLDRWPLETGGATPLACAAALATIDVIAAEGFLDRIRARGRQLVEGLRAVAERRRGLTGIRGSGLMVSTDVVDGAGREDAARCAAVVHHCREVGRLLLTAAGEEQSTVRFTPPLVVTEQEVDLAVAAFDAAMAATAGSAASL